MYDVPALVPAVAMTWKSSPSVTSLKVRLDPAESENAPPVTETEYVFLKYPRGATALPELLVEVDLTAAFGIGDISVLF